MNPYMLFVSIVLFLQLMNRNEIFALKNIKPAERKYIQYVENTNGTIVFNSILTRQIQQLNNDEDKSVFLIIQKYQKAKGVDIDSSLVDAVNLKPISYRTHIATSGYYEQVEFLDDSINVKIINNDSSNVQRHKNNDLFNGVILTDLIGELRLEKGLNYSLRMVNPGIRYREYDVSIKVLGEESLNLGFYQNLKCWKLKIDYGVPNSSTIDWYTVDGQVQVRSRFQLKSGSTFIREMIL